MTAKNPKEVFVQLLSNLQQGNERTTEVFETIGEVAQDPEIKEALQARVLISDQIAARIDQCFKLIEERPVKMSSRLYDVFAEDFRRELAEIQNPVARTLFVLAKATHLLHLRIAQYVALTAAADITGNYAVGVLLESCLADKLAFAERTRRLIRRVVETGVAERMAERTAA
jgi:ferritin-like metal-binding protein YciE